MAKMADDIDDFVDELLELLQLVLRTDWCPIPDVHQKMMLEEFQQSVVARVERFAAAQRVKVKRELRAAAGA